MRCCRVKVLVLMTGLLAAAQAWEVAAQPQRVQAKHSELIRGGPTPTATKEPAFQAQGMVPLAGGALLVWAADGRVQVGSPERGWMPEVRLPMTYIASATADAEGALVGGSHFPKGGTESAVAVVVDSQGAVRTQWQGGEGLFSSVTSAFGRRWAIALDQLVELLPDGGVQAESKVPALSQLLVGQQEQKVLCTPANRTLAHVAPAECRANGPGGWHVQGPWKLPPLLCGEWLIMQEGTELVVRLLASGNEVNRRAVAGNVYACGQTELLAGGKQVQALALPSLKRLWQQPCGRGQIVALASTKEGGACLNSRGSVRRLNARGVDAPGIQ